MMKDYWALLQSYLGKNPDMFGLDQADAEAIIEGIPDTKRFIESVPATLQGERFAQAYAERPDATTDSDQNPLRQRFESWNGNGIHKWEHYFEPYWTHLSQFRGKTLNVLEIGVYSGGSLQLWRDFFGEGCTIHGIDIEPECKKYANAYTTIHLGDQGDREFWRDFKKEVPKFDIVIDDGGHFPHQQRITLEEMVPHMNPGGVYICEDIHHRHNSFLAYTAGLVNELFTFKRIPGENLTSEMSDYQASVKSINYYTFMMVIQLAATDDAQFRAAKRGSAWQEFNARGLKGK